MTQLALFFDPAVTPCPIRSVPFADGHGSVRVHECGRYAGNIWPCRACGDPGDPSVPAVAVFCGEGSP